MFLNLLSWNFLLTKINAYNFNVIKHDRIYLTRGNTDLNLFRNTCSNEEFYRLWYSNLVYNPFYITTSGDYNPICFTKFKFFFKNLNLPIPPLFNKIKSLKEFRNPTDFMRLSAHLQRSGKTVTTVNTLLNSYYMYLTMLRGTNLFNNQALVWRDLYFNLGNFCNFINKDIFYLTQFSTFEGINVNSKSRYVLNTLLKSEDLTLRGLYRESFKKFNFLFSFYVHRVDKQIYKNSRGRSGKFTFIWKYVPSYKRNSLILHWLTKEVRITAGKKFNVRSSQVLQMFLSAPEKTWIWKIKKFSLNYVYYNLRRTLAETCKTSFR